MKRVLVVMLLGVALTVLSAWSVMNDTTVSFKCLIQLTNYGGEGAYVVTSLIDADGNYVQTLFVGGFEEEWYPDLPDWYTFYGDDWESIDGITGASIQSGGRKVALLKIGADKLDSGYELRFESAVEDEAYHGRDVEMDLTSENINQTIGGTGYIRHIRMISR